MAFLVRRQALSSGCLPVFFISAVYIEGVNQRQSCGLDPTEGILGTVGTVIVSKSSFLLLLTVAFLATAASLQSGGAWLGKMMWQARYEVHQDIAALRYDVRELRDGSGLVPYALRSLWIDVRSDGRIIEADVSADARVATRRLSVLIKTN